MRIGIPGHSLYQIGGDGGLLENPIVHPPIDPSSTDGGLVLTPGERADVIFIPNGNGPYELTWFDTARGRHTTFYNPDGTIGIGHAHDDGKRPSQVLMTFQTYGKKFNGNTSVPANLRTIAPINTAGASTIPVMFGHSTPDATGNVTFFVAMKNGMPLPFPAVTPADAPAVNVGETRIWEVTNLTGGDHNFHSHGFTFQHIETEFIDAITPANNYVVPASHLENKDTFRVPRRPGAKGTSRVIVRFAAKFTDEGREGLTEAYGKVPSATTSGGWLFHCHILEHSRNGMMSFLQVFND